MHWRLRARNFLFAGDIYMCIYITSGKLSHINNKHFDGIYEERWWSSMTFGIKFLSRFSAGKLWPSYFSPLQQIGSKIPQNTRFFVARFFRGHTWSPHPGVKKIHKSKAKKICVFFVDRCCFLVFWGSVITKWETETSMHMYIYILLGYFPLSGCQSPPGWQSPLLGLGISKKNLTIVTGRWSHVT